MPKSKLTPELIERVAHWRRFGLGREAIAVKLKGEGFDVTGRTVSRVPKGNRGDNPHGWPTRGDNLHARLGEQKSAAKRGAAVVATVAEELERHGDDAGDVLDHLRARLAEVRGLADDLSQVSKEGGRNAAVYCQLVRLEGDLAARIHELTPPVLPDPSVDPANVAARELLIATIEALVSGEVQP